MMASSDDKMFGDMVKVQLGKRDRNSSSKDYPCLTCYERFDDQWVLNEHLRKAHL